VRRGTAGSYAALNPTTKFVIAVGQAALAFIMRGWGVPLAVLATVLVTAAVAGVTRRLLPFVAATIPLVASIVLVNTFIYPGATDVIAPVGPFTPTWTGLVVALQTMLRVVAFALSVALFALTTPTDDLLSDLERRGLGRRGIFVIGAAIATVPRMIERAGEIIDAQRARGLDTEGSPWRRIRGVVPLAGPMISGALSEVEERTMALEARAFSAPGRRTIIRTLPDTQGERLLRWVIGGLVLVALFGTILGVVNLP
jgi:energy-coupling factor transport system permease protein